MVSLTTGVLSREVPRRTETVRFNWVQKTFQQFGVFAAARKRMGLREYTHCYWCRRAFVDDDMLALAQPEKGANRLLCQACAEQATSSSGGG
ncbi:MAG TPA: hypothetical protein VHL05_14985 [Terriglobales bacterium]|jgi:hypothetical protein|nr:hypothetical protein [Terriglobales bacterium]